MYAAEVAALFAEARLKFKWERFALAGERSNRGASEGGRRRGTSDKINDRRGPLINCYLQKRAEKWEHDTACRYASEHAHQGSEFEAYSLKQAKRILERYK